MWDNYISEPVRIEFEDGSEFTLPEVWGDAFEEQFADRMDEAKQYVADLTADHFERETKPDRDEPELSVSWDEDLYELPSDVLADEYETHADLAPEIIYPHLSERIAQIATRRIMFQDDEKNKPMF